MLNCIPKHKCLLRTTGIILLALLIATGLTGCLVKKKDLDKFARTTDNLRVYQPGDYIVYDVSATRVPQIGLPEYTSGTLRINWNLHANLTVPFTGGATTIPVIQEVTTLNLIGSTSNEGTTRYISQDANGQVTLHAIEAIGTEDHFWLNTLGDSDLTFVEYFTIFNSPITFGDQDFDSYNPETAITTVNPNINFYVLEDCEGNANCNSAVGLFTDDYDVVGDSTEITTNLGIFVNPFQIQFSGGATPTPTFPVVFDVRDVCGTQATTHSGTMYVLPEVGMVQMTSTCSDPNSTVYYTITLSNTNIPLP
ncbi:hypothetical protein [Kaarinaea lacus]